MTAVIGRNPCTILSPDHELYAFYNSRIPNDPFSVGGLRYFGPTGVEQFRCDYGTEPVTNFWRCLHYSRALPNGAINEPPRMVPFLSNPEAKLAEPLYETISPSVGFIAGENAFSMVFWTNLAGATNTLEPVREGTTNAAFLYDSSKVLRFNDNALDDVVPSEHSLRALCNARIEWRKLETQSLSYFERDDLSLVPVVTRVDVLLVQDGGIATDFAAGGSGDGGGFRRHNHADNDNGGFAYAVFAPGTTLRPIDWR